MKKWIYILCLMIWVTQVSAIGNVNKIAIIDISNIFQQSAKRTEVIKQLEDEFKDRANELEMMEHDLQMKIQTLQRDGAKMKADERNALEKLLVNQREIFSNKAKIFQQDNHTRQAEERDKILNVIYNIVKKIAKKENYDIVIDTSAVVYYGTHVRNITDIVMQQIE